MSVFRQIIKLLDETNIPFTQSKHAETITSEDAARVRGVDLKTGAKAMIAESKGIFYQFVLPGNRKIDWKLVKSHLGIKDISLAKEDDVEQKFGLKRGSVPPFGNLFGIKVFYDDKLLENEFVNFNAGSLTDSVQMRTKDLVKVVKPEVFLFSKD